MRETQAESRLPAEIGQRLKQGLPPWQGILAVVCTGGVFPFLFLSLRGDPKLEGRPLEAWLIQSALAERRAAEPARRVLVEHANRVEPVLLRWVVASDSGWWSAVQKGQSALGRNVDSDRLTAGERRALAIHGFSVLGDAGRRAVPALVALFDRGQEPGSVALALTTLGESGREGVESGLRHPDPDVRNAVLLALVGYGDRRAVDAAGAALNDEQAWVRFSAVRTLLRLHVDPERSVPHLIRALEDPFPLVRRYAADALGSFEREAESAVPNLVKLLGDADGRVVRSARNALGQIAPGSTFSPVMESPDRER